MNQWKVRKLFGKPGLMDVALYLLFKNFPTLKKGGQGGFSFLKHRRLKIPLNPPFLKGDGYLKPLNIPGGLEVYKSLFQRGKKPFEQGFEIFAKVAKS